MKNQKIYLILATFVFLLSSCGKTSRVENIPVNEKDKKKILINVV